MQHLVELQDVSKQYGSNSNSLKALNNVSFTVSEGEFLGIMGASGSGKSTLLNALATIDTITEGSIYISNQNLSDLSEDELAEFRRSSLGFVFQDYNLLNTLTLRENIALGLVIKKADKRKIDSFVNEVAVRLGIAEFLDKYPYEVSGGQRQRCACARAVASEPGLILADEPTGALDSTSAKNLMETFEQMNGELGVTILMVTHDAFSACWCKRILFMKDGEIVSELVKGNKDNRGFLECIMDRLTAINEGEPSVS